MDALLFLTNLVVILFLGVIFTIISKKLRISNVLVLILLGLFMKFINAVMNQNDIFKFDFSASFLVAISILGLAMVVFDGSSRFKLKEVDAMSSHSLRLVGIFLLFNIILVAFVTNLLFFNSFSAENIIFSLIFAIVVSGTDPGSVFFMLKNKSNRIVKFLELEAIMNTPIIIIIPFLLVDFINNLTGAGLVVGFVNLVSPFLLQLFVGVGVGIIIGVVLFKSIRKAYSARLTPLVVMIAALLSYILSENLGGSGVLAVATLGLVFGNVYIKHKAELQEFSSLFSDSLEILVFVLLGFIIEIPFTWSFFLKSLIIFIVLLISRFLAISVSLRGSVYALREKFFMAINMPKGIAVAVVAFSFTVLKSDSLGTITNLILIFIIYSLILSSLADRFAKRFIGIKID